MEEVGERVKNDKFLAFVCICPSKASLEILEAKPSALTFLVPRQKNCHSARPGDMAAEGERAT